MNNKEQDSVRARITWLKDGKDWGCWRGNVRFVDEKTVNTVFGNMTVQVDGERTYLHGEKRVGYIPTKDYARLMQKNIGKLVDL